MIYGGEGRGRPGRGLGSSSSSLMLSEGARVTVRTRGLPGTLCRGVIYSALRDCGPGFRVYFPAHCFSGGAKLCACNHDAYVGNQRFPVGGLSQSPPSLMPVCQAEPPGRRAGPARRRHFHRLQGCRAGAGDGAQLCKRFFRARYPVFQRVYSLVTQ